MIDRENGLKNLFSITRLRKLIIFAIKLLCVFCWLFLDKALLKKILQFQKVEI